MKIRRYKGHSLNKLYEAIQDELGPEAVVVSASRPSGLSALMPPLLGGHPYELIAVVDDASSDRHMLGDAARSADIKKLSVLQERKWETVEDHLQELRKEIGVALKGAGGSVSFAPGGAPEFASDWDPLFLKTVLSHGPTIFDAANRAACRQVVQGLLRVEEAFPVQAARRPHIVVLVGPTGSGKTTTLAKLAARWTLDRKLKVGLISTDTYRVAAVDQIKEYATLLGVELKIAFSASEAAQAARLFADKDVVLVDTPGRSHYDQAGLMGLRGVLQGMGAVTMLMTLPATTDRRNVADIVNNFQLLKLNYMVMTKIDETRHYDVLTAMASHAACPLAFLTDGQRVPQDIRAARLAELTAMLLPEDQN